MADELKPSIVSLSSPANTVTLTVSEDHKQILSKLFDPHYVSNVGVPFHKRNLPPSFFLQPSEERRASINPDDKRLFPVTSPVHSKSNSSPASFYTGNYDVNPSLGNYDTYRKECKTSTTRTNAKCEQESLKRISIPDRKDIFEICSLEPKYELALNASDQVYFLNHDTQQTTWFDPRLPLEYQRWGMNLSELEELHRIYASAMQIKAVEEETLSKSCFVKQEPHQVPHNRSFSQPVSCPREQYNEKSFSQPGIRSTLPSDAAKCLHSPYACQMNQDSVSSVLLSPHCLNQSSTLSPLCAQTTLSGSHSPIHLVGSHEEINNVFGNVCTTQGTCPSQRLMLIEPVNMNIHGSGTTVNVCHLHPMSQKHSPYASSYDSQTGVLHPSYNSPHSQSGGSPNPSLHMSPSSTVAMLVQQQPQPQSVEQGNIFHGCGNARGVVIMQTSPMALNTSPVNAMSPQSIGSGGAISHYVTPDLPGYPSHRSPVQILGSQSISTVQHGAASVVGHSHVLGSSSGTSVIESYHSHQSSLDSGVGSGIYSTPNTHVSMATEFSLHGHALMNAVGMGLSSDFSTIKCAPGRSKHITSASGNVMLNRKVARLREINQCDDHLMSTSDSFSGGEFNSLLLIDEPINLDDLPDLSELDLDLPMESSDAPI